MVRAVAALLLFMCARVVAAPAARVIVLSTREARTRPMLVEIERHGATISASAPMAFGMAPEVHHADRATVHGALAGDDIVFVVEETTGRFASSLWRVTRTDSVRVVESVVTAARPLVSGRRVYVTTGRPQELNETATREDDLVVTELDLDGGTTRPVAHLVGQTAQPLGVDNELGLLVYGVTPHASRGNVLAFDLNGEPPRDLGSIGPASNVAFVTRMRIPGHLLGPSVVYDTNDGEARVIAALGLDGERSDVVRAKAGTVVPLVIGDQLVPVERTARAMLVPRAIARDGSRLYERRLIPVGTESLLVRAADGAEAIVPVPPGESWELVGFLR